MKALKIDVVGLCLITVPQTHALPCLKRSIVSGRLKVFKNIEKLFVVEALFMTISSALKSRDPSLITPAKDKVRIT